MALYINQSLGHSVIPDYTVLDGNFESLVARSCNHSTTLVYRPPSSSITAFFGFLEGLLEYSVLSNCPIVLQGDLNTDQLSSNSLCAELIDLLHCYPCENIINSLTRITPSCETLFGVCNTN